MVLQDRRMEALILKVTGRPTRIRPEQRLVEDLHLDSLKIFELLMHLEDDLDVIIPVGDMSRIRTVADLTRAVATLEENPASVDAGH